MAGRRGPEPRIDFSHALHLEQGATCEQCHGAVAEATDTSKTHLPAQAVCLECHEADSCESCAKLPSARDEQKDVDEQTLGFSHAAHLPRVEGDCTKCHGNAHTATELPVQTPSMALCLTCHNHSEEYQASRCTRCHPVLQRLPLEAVAEFSHGGNWIERHGMLARTEGAACQECHPQPMCASCHSRVTPAAPARLFPEKVEGTLLHRGDFLTTHSIEARADGDTCYRCHDQQYCESCHASFNVAGPGAQSPHPAGFGSGAVHGRAARERIETCAACHDQGAASNCVVCHSSGGPGGNPHPAGWADRYDLEDAREEQVCRTCHGI